MIDLLSSSKKLLIIEDRASGHHLTYLRKIIIGFSASGVEVVVGTNHPAVRACADAHGVTVLDLPAINRGKCSTLFQTVLMQWRQWFVLRRAVRALRKVSTAQLGVFLPFLDDYCGLFSPPGFMLATNSVAISGILFRPKKYWIPPRLRWVREGMLDTLGVLSTHSLACICTLDEVAAPLLSRDYKKPVLIFPDIVNLEQSKRSHEIASELRHLAGRKSIVSLLGTISTRKGVGRFLQAAAENGGNCFFVLAGSLDRDNLMAEELSLLTKFESEPGGNVLVRSGGFDDGPEFNGYVMGSDAIYVCTQDFPYSSNIMIKAAAFRVPIVSESEYLIGHRMSRFSLGFSLQGKTMAEWCNSTSQAELQALARSNSFTRDCQAFAASHTDGAVTVAISHLMAHLFPGTPGS